MSQVNTCLIGATVIVMPDPEITADGVDSKEVEGVIVSTFLMIPIPQMPQFQAPHFSVLVDGTIWPVVPACRIRVLNVPALENVTAISA